MLNIRCCMDSINRTFERCFMEHLQPRKTGHCNIGLSRRGTCCKIKNSAPLRWCCPPRVRNDLQVEVFLIVWKQKERLKVDDYSDYRVLGVTSSAETPLSYLLGTN